MHADWSPRTYMADSLFPLSLKIKSNMIKKKKERKTFWGYLVNWVSFTIPLAE